MNTALFSGVIIIIIIVYEGVGCHENDQNCLLIAPIWEFVPYRWFKRSHRALDFAPHYTWGAPRLGMSYIER